MIFIWILYVITFDYVSNLNIEGYGGDIITQIHNEPNSILKSFVGSNRNLDESKLGRELNGSFANANL